MIQKWKPYQKHALSFMLTIAMLFSTSITAFASESNPKVQPDMMGDTQLNGQQAANMAETVSPSVVTVTAQNDQRNVKLNAEEQNQPEQTNQPQAAGIATSAAYPSYQKAYDTMISLKKDYPEGMTWTNFVPYGTGEGAIGPHYTFNGGAVKGAKLGVGCAAFVFILSDKVFGDIQATTYDKGNFEYKDIHVGDILRVNNNSHFVIVLQKSSAGVIVAEANYNKTVHWGRAMSAAEVMAADFVVSRYPKNYVDESVSNADKIVETGTESKDLSWSLTQNGVLTISGSGVIQSYDFTNRPSWEGERSGQITAIHIESGITGIGDYAFYKTPALDVYIPDTVTHIGNSAFRQSPNIVGITIPGRVESIGDDAFYYCTSLTSVSTFEGLKSIGERAFQNCTALRYIDFPASITNVGSGAFMSCENIQRVRFAPGTVRVSIGNDLFNSCWYLTSVTLPENINRISNGMFYGCKSLKDLYIPAGVEYIYEAGQSSVSPFSSSGISTIYFCGSKDDWEKKGGNSAINNGLNIDVKYDQLFNNPFAPIAGDPGDLITDPTAHIHGWATDYGHDAAYHWHECNTPGCTLTDNAKKDGYGEHVYSEWVVDTAATAYSAGSKHRDCTVCGYRQTESIPATGGSWGNPGGSWNYGGSNGTGNTGNNTNNTDNTNNGSDDTSNSTDDTNNGSGDTSNNQNNSDNGSGETTSPDSDTKPDDTVTPSNPAKAKKQMKTELKSEMKVSLKKQLNTQLKAKLKKQFGKLPKSKLKAKLKKQLKTQLDAKLKKQLKKKMQKQFQKSLGKQFAAEYKKQYQALFDQLYTKQFDTLFNQLYKKRKAAK